MILSDEQVKTEEVKSWEGLHLLHFQGSSCSQKVRILLREKNIPHVSRPVNLATNEHISSWFLGINPRGVVPVLVHDGQVHVESNDILEHIDQLPSEADSFFPQTDAERQIVKESLDLEDSLHMDLRNLTTGFILPRKMVTKSEETLERYEREGAEDPARAKELLWWRNFAENGVTDEAARDSIAAYRTAFEQLEERLSESEWLIGERISVLDLAWFISANRLKLAGYPLEIHPHLTAWYEKLLSRTAFAEESTMGFVPEKIIIPLYSAFRRSKGTTIGQMMAQ